ncbi:MAG TPA: hypothetical protein VHT75_04380 [Acidimicrobiales bacterium]|jgi:hypothetical protein|nr:hypothetical protein [Acidimicrobiales bacterium]
MNKPKLAVLIGFAVLAAAMTITAAHSSQTLHLVRTNAVHVVTTAAATTTRAITAIPVRPPAVVVPKRQGVPVAAIVTTTTIAAPENNGQPCPQCTPGNGATAPNGDANGTPINTPDLIVYIVHPDGTCGATGQSEAQRDGFTAIPASECDHGDYVPAASAAQTTTTLPNLTPAECAVTPACYAGNGHQSATTTTLP